MDRHLLRVPQHESGFTMIEVMIASVILIVGLVSMAYCFGLGLGVVMTAQEDTIARQKAREAMEDVFTARDTSTITYDQVCNEPATGCIFKNGFTLLTTAGPDGIVNTDDDGSVEFVDTPGPDGILGTSDDVLVPLSNYQRQIQVKTVPIPTPLKQIIVTIKYTTSNGLTRTVVLTALMSPYV